MTLRDLERETLRARYLATCNPEFTAKEIALWCLWHFIKFIPALAVIALAAAYAMNK